MNKSLFTITTVSIFLLGILFTSCQTSAEKVDSAQTKLKDAKMDLKQEQKDSIAAAQKTADAAAWMAYKNEQAAMIAENEKSITELKAIKKAKGKALDAMYVKEVDALEQKNKDLNNRIIAYDKDQSNWEVFKAEFSRDMSELGTSLRDFTVKNKK
jgi:uncharacterized protein YicC (UPF0701 family)